LARLLDGEPAEEVEVSDPRGGGVFPAESLISDMRTEYTGWFGT
jgi:hypothetical protein